jgi:hypothetical protein
MSDETPAVGPVAEPGAPEVGSQAWQAAEAERMVNAWRDATPTPTHIQRRESQARADVETLSELIGEAPTAADIVDTFPQLRSDIVAGEAAQERIRELEWDRSQADAEATALAAVDAWESAEIDDGDVHQAVADLTGTVGLFDPRYLALIQRIGQSDWQAAQAASRFVADATAMANAATRAAEETRAQAEQQRQIQETAAALQKVNDDFLKDHPDVARYAPQMNELAEQSGLVRTGDAVTDRARLDALLAASQELDPNLAGSASWEAREQMAMFNTTDALRARIKSPAEMSRFTAQAEARGLVVDQTTGLVSVPVPDVIERTLERATAPTVAEVHAQAQENVMEVGSVRRDLQGQLRRNRAVRDQPSAERTQPAGPLPDYRPPRETEWDRYQAESVGRKTLGAWWD